MDSCACTTSVAAARLHDRGGSCRRDDRRGCVYGDAQRHALRSLVDDSPISHTKRSAADGRRSVSSLPAHAARPPLDGEVLPMDPLAAVRLDDSVTLRAPTYATTNVSGAVLALD